MKGHADHIDDDRWHALCRSATSVRANLTEVEQSSPRRLRRGWVAALYAGGLTALTLAALRSLPPPLPVHADGSADGALFALTNQDRASNGVRSVNGNGTLQNIGEGGRYGGCPGLTVFGRSVDMIQRNYFAHPILGCGQYVFSIMQAYGVRYQSAGENIGWNGVGGSGAAASAINNAFMNSPEHRSNILNGNYTDLGVGSDNSGSQAWTGGGGAYTGVWMFSEEFAQLASAPPPPPPPPPPAPPSTGRPVRNSPPPAAPAQPPTNTNAPSGSGPAPVASPGVDTGPGAGAAPAPTATLPAAPSPAPSATPLPTAPTLLVPPLSGQPGGLLSDSVESVLESYLIG